MRSCAERWYIKLQLRHLIDMFKFIFFAALASAQLPVSNKAPIDTDNRLIKCSPGTVPKTYIDPAVKIAAMYGTHCTPSGPTEKGNCPPGYAVVVKKDGSSICVIDKKHPVDVCPPKTRLFTVVQPSGTWETDCQHPRNGYAYRAVPMNCSPGTSIIPGEKYNTCVPRRPRRNVYPDRS